MSIELNIDRYPHTKDQSLKAWNAADELILTYIQEENLSIHSPIFINDRFGYLTCHLYDSQPQVVGHYKSQEISIHMNLIGNSLPEISFIGPLMEQVNETDHALIKIPKSMDLFRLMLHQLSDKLTSDGTVICGFMTKYFSPQITKIAEEYFDDVQQTRAFKKARLMILSNKKPKPSIDILNSFEWKNNTYLQYLGVFSSGHIDYATQYFLEHLKIQDSDLNILDLASGNGVIAKFIREQNPNSNIHLIDDSWLAVESSKKNLTEGQNIFHYSNTLEDIEDGTLDLIVSNPPFHFDFEPNIEITYSLFTEVKDKLKSDGRFELVANRHLPYKPFLEELFDDVTVLNQNRNFIIYSCHN